MESDDNHKVAGFVSKGKRKDLLPVAAGKFLPHRPPMLFVERLLEREGDRAVAETTLPTVGIAVCAGKLLPEYFIELIAQTAALANGFDLFCEGQAPNDGMLVGIDGFTTTDIARPGRLVRVETDKTFSFGPINVISGTIWDGELQLACGVIKVWENVD